MFEEKLSRETSLSKALSKSNEKVILLEGDPGSGKSVALRHLALKLSEEASKSKNFKKTIPIYINLKSLERGGQDVDQNLIKNHIYKTLNRVNSREIETFLEDEFAKGLEEGTWLFLFDSFDEIPEVLSSVEADEKIQIYAKAITDFLEVYNNQCRGIISSREYRGPKILNIPKFKILPLSESKQGRLIRSIDLDGVEASTIIGELGVSSSSGLRLMASNPMFLSLLCKYVSQSKDFPKNSYLVYEKYIENRLKRDSARLKKRFKFTPDEVRTAAESLAYCMTAEKNLGLSPIRKDLLDALEKYNRTLGSSSHDLLDALEYLGIARADEEATSKDEKYFTFTHRRFQEYFATSVILSEQSHVSPKDLLTNGKWRETTVVLLQTQPEERLTELLDSATEFIKASAKELNCQSYAQEADFSSANPVASTKTIIRWPEKLIHILGILQEGLLENERQFLTIPQRSIDDLLSFATIQGTLLDRKISLKVSGIASSKTQEKMLETAFRTNSQWLNDVAYAQTSYLPVLSPFLQKCIRYSLLNKAYSGNLYQHTQVSETFIQRLNNADLVDAFRLTASLPIIELFNKSLSLAILFSLRYKMFPDFFNSHSIYKLIGDTFIFLVVINFGSTLVNFIPGINRTKRKFNLASTFDALVVFLLVTLFIISMTWLFWLDGFRASGMDVSELPFPIPYLDRVLFSKTINFGQFIGICWLFVIVELHSYSWGKTAVYNLCSGRYLKWYFWPFYQALGIFRFINKTISEVIGENFLAAINSLILFPSFLYLKGKKIIRYIARQNKWNQLKIFLLTLSPLLVLRFWEISFFVAVFFVFLFVSFVLIRFVLCAFYSLLLWGLLRYLEGRIRPKIRKISHERREKFFCKVLKDGHFSLSLISDGLEERRVIDSDSFFQLIYLIKQNIDPKNIFEKDVEYIRILALEIENFQGHSLSFSRATMGEYLQIFRPSFLSDRMIEFIDYSSRFLVQIFMSKAEWFARWEYVFFELQDAEDLKTLSGRVKVNLSDPRFAFLRHDVWVEELYVLLESVGSL